MNRSSLVATLLACLGPVWAITATGSQSLGVNIGAAGKVAVVQSSVTLTRTGGTFGNYTGSATLQYKIRTTTSTGSSSITAKASGDFTPTAGPRISNSELTYTCSGATTGTGCSGTQTVSTSSQTSVITVGSGVCTGTGCAGSDPNSVTVNLTLENDPGYKTGTYSTSLVFTISAL